MQISSRDGVHLRAVDLVAALRRYGPTKMTLALRELVATGFSLEDLGLTAAEVDRFGHGRPGLRLIRGRKKNGSRIA